MSTGQESDEISDGHPISLTDFLLEADTTFPNPTLPDAVRNVELLKAERKVEESYPNWFQDYFFADETGPEQCPYLSSTGRCLS